ncbi:hypothetical protein D9M68_513120 [compost metagenome]
MSVKQIKTLLIGIIILLSLLIFLQSCEKSATLTLTGTIILKDKVPQSLIHQDKTILITAFDFQESRCPANANCIWQGFASVKLSIRDDLKIQEIILCNGACTVPGLPSAQTLSLNGTSFNIKLEEINPFPVLNTAKTVSSSAKLSISQ